MKIEDLSKCMEDIIFSADTPIVMQKKEFVSFILHQRCPLQEPYLSELS